MWTWWYWLRFIHFRIACEHVCTCRAVPHDIPASCQLHDVLRSCRGCVRFISNLIIWQRPITKVIALFCGCCLCRHDAVYLPIYPNPFTTQICCYLVKCDKVGKKIRKLYEKARAQSRERGGGTDKPVANSELLSSHGSMDSFHGNLQLTRNYHLCEGYVGIE